jgi:hypothetical protein
MSWPETFALALAAAALLTALFNWHRSWIDRNTQRESQRTLREAQETITQAIKAWREAFTRKD